MATTPDPTPTECSKLADQLFDEWKYRHKNFWRTLYRFLSAIAILVTVPFVKNEYFRPTASSHVTALGITTRGVYVSLPIIMFVALCLVLIHDHARIRSIEQSLNKARGDCAPTEPNLCQAFHEAFTKRTGWIAILFIVIGFFLLTWWFCILKTLPSTAEHENAQKPTVQNILSQ